MKGEYITVILTWLEKKINELKQLLLCHFYVTFYYPLAYFDSGLIVTRFDQIEKKLFFCSDIKGR